LLDHRDKSEFQIDIIRSGFIMGKKPEAVESVVAPECEGQLTVTPVLGKSKLLTLSDMTSSGPRGKKGSGKMRALIPIVFVCLFVCSHCLFVCFFSFLTSVFPFLFTFICMYSLAYF
jgi:hypothetical protein